ncbi:2Fe-2S ferredoxin-type domain-containing protein [Tribonema minus]|uniref:Ferredoxin n=1 Tax=Tribonema minus TaxID=303371 RepID=A0A835YL41_9STRA|nr:2Fe-2S ferredoxin-type domain-containing protein [Tribonema minus]
MAAGQNPSPQELVKAVEALQAQVTQLTALVKEMAASEANGAAAAPAAKINGAAVPLKAPTLQTGLIAGTVASAPPGEILVPVSAAEARIQSFLASQGKAAPPAAAAAAAPAAAVAPPPPPAAVPAAPAAPAPEAPPGDGYVVTIDWDGATHVVRCDGETTVLEAAMDAGLDLPHSCMSGSCLTCPGRLSAGRVEQGDGVLEDDQIAAGLMLTCVSYPLSDLRFEVIGEDEL